MGYMTIGPVTTRSLRLDSGQRDLPLTTCIYSPHVSTEDERRAVRAILQFADSPATARAVIEALGLLDTAADLAQ